MANNKDDSYYGVKCINTVISYDDYETIDMDEHIKWLLEEEMKSKC